MGRLDSRLEGKTWKISRWWWEDGVRPDIDALGGLTDAACRFLRYLRAERLVVASGFDRKTRHALLAANRTA